MLRKVPYSLLLMPAIPSADDGVISDLGDAKGWRRSIRSLGGYWQGSFMLEREPAQIMDAFYNWLGCHVRERVGSVITWEGLVYELELNHRGHRMIRSLDNLYNAVDLSYQSDNEVYTTGFTTQAQSINRYGRREIMLTADGEPSATAQERRDLHLAQHAWPWARPVSFDQSELTELSVTVCGYAFTANWMLAQAADGTNSNLSDWISTLVGTAYGLSSDHGGSVSGAGDCEFLKGGTIDANTLQVPEVIEGDPRPWDLIADLVEIGASSSTPWRAWVGADRELHYREIDTEPAYYRRADGVYDGAASDQKVVPWLVQPAVLRDLEFPSSWAERGSWLEDARDLYLDEITVEPHGALAFTASYFVKEAKLGAAPSTRSGV